MSPLPDDHSTSDQGQFWSLVRSDIEGTLADSEAAQLEEMLLADRKLAALYLDFLRLHVDLELWSREKNSCDANLAGISQEFASAALQSMDSSVYSDEMSVKLASSSADDVVHRRVKDTQFHLPRYFAIGTAVAAAVTLLILSVAHLTKAPAFIAEDRDHGQAVDEKQAYVARLLDWHKPVWMDETRPPLSDPRLVPGQRLVIAAGLLEVVYNTGAKVVIEGPAEFFVGTKDEEETARSSIPQSSPLNPHSSESNAGYLTYGKLVARVDTEEAKSFTIHTPTTRVEDLGTEFAVAVARSGNTVLHVFEGVVQLGGDNGASPQTVRAGGSYRVDRDSSGAVATVAVSTQAKRFTRAHTAQRAKSLAAAWPADVVKTPSRDTFVSARNPDEDYSAADELLVKSASPDPTWTREAWLQFDLDEIDFDRVIDVELVLFTSPGIGSDNTLRMREFELLARACADTEDLQLNSHTWGTTRSLETKLVKKFYVSAAAPLGHELRVGGAELVEWMRGHSGKRIELVIRRLSTSKAHVSGFASSEQGDIGPALQFWYPSEPANTSD